MGTRRQTVSNHANRLFAAARHIVHLRQVRRRPLTRFTIRWPCSYEYEDAAVYLCAAIPVKVLPFRKVACLQNPVVAGEQPSERAEEHVEAALFNARMRLYTPQSSSRKKALTDNSRRRRRRRRRRGDYLCRQTLFSKLSLDQTIDIRE